jgi:transposase
MTSNNSKYNLEFRERTCKHILESGKSATSIGEELGVDKNTICAWVRQYRKQNKLPSYAESKGIKIVSTREAKVVNAQNKIDKKRITELEDEIEILKKALRIFMQAS